MLEQENKHGYITARDVSVLSPHLPKPGSPMGVGAR